MTIIRWIILVALCCISGLCRGQHQQKLVLEKLPSLSGADLETSNGFAGMMGGKQDGVLIAAGGANFPDGFPWEGGKKVWSDAIYYLKGEQWKLASQRLPLPLAYGSSVSLNEGILLIGGENAQGSTSQVLLLSFDPRGESFTLTDYPKLPEPLAYSSAVVENGYVYVIGGKNALRSTNSFYRLSLATKSWEKLPDFPGQPRALHVAAVQDTQHSRKLFVIGGRNQRKGQKSIPLRTFLAYDLFTGEWQELGELQIGGTPKVLMGAYGRSVGSMHIMVYGGSDEVLFNKLEAIALRMQSVQNDSIINALRLERDEILKDHPGFSNGVLSYNTITGKWFEYESLDRPLPVTALSFADGQDVFMVSGEVSPGIRTTRVQKITEGEAVRAFGAINYIVLFGYLMISLLIGVYFSYKQKSTNDYFVGGGRIPWWASGLSVFGTLLSAITFMAIPAKAFVTDWSFFMLNMAAIAITPLISLVFIPFFNRLKITTAYEFLEDRFNYTARAFGSLSFILFQLGRIGIVLLLPSLAISIVTGIPVETSILMMALLCIAYTAFGGIEAVIWTDVLQVIVLLGGSVLAVIWIMLHTESSFGDMIGYASAQQKFNVANMDLDFTKATFWVVTIGGLASAMVTQGTDQTIVQRYLTSTDMKNSQKTLYTNAILTLPASVIFFGLGTLLFIFYSEFPARLSPTISNNDSIFPMYIVKELPVGVSGLLVAGIFSAAMSSISSSLNSVSTAFCNDFYKRFKRDVADKRLLRIARMVTVLTGLIGMLLALWMANSNIKSLWDEFYRYLGLFTGGLGGMFLLGMLTKRANARGTLLGLFASAVLIWYISVFTNISFLMYAFFGLVSCFVFGYLFSLFFKPKGNH
ncbi:sodium:solute symporter family transporter [Flagellimonas halotolerans]|uniref:Sodium/solute symporter n=1 Tax=Flagellimonas halotolerans TaxID=3112164 RepID=A0ABU6IUR9_9FLAO|nr:MULTISPECIES: sodium/solute symporter [unclassified Allomuricauda]MEC3966946.1 sodium/solute symporter [Muricauda sp. SYSU M86414]MEC4266809.1 sodium/solute symporter [Muricauda sp. SYSU M84420]